MMESESETEKFFEHLRWRLPEYWMLALSASAWVALAAAPFHNHQAGATADWLHWMLMVTAMMLPLKIDGVRLTAERSLWLRRHRAVAAYLTGYLSVWVLVGIPLTWAFATFNISNHLNWMTGAAIGFLTAAAWLISPWKALATSLCHRTVPLAPAGWRADRDCLSYGWIAGCACALNCWPLMLVCWLSGHSLFAMCCAFGMGWVDRHFAPSYKANALVMTTLAVMFGVFSQIR